MEPGENLTPEHRRTLAEQIRASREELERLVESFDHAPGEVFDQAARQWCIALLRDLRAGLVKAWHRVNHETSWPGALRGPIKIESLTPLIQSEIVEAIAVLDVEHHFVVEGGALDLLFDREFEDGTALELALGEEGSAEFPLARLAFVLIPAERNLILFAGHVVTRREGEAEWPKACPIHSKIGSLRADRWVREELETFIQHITQEFHAAVAEEAAARNSLTS